MKRPVSSLTLFYSLALTIKVAGKNGLPLAGLRDLLTKHIPESTLDRLLSILRDARLVRESWGRLYWSGPK